MRLPHRLTSKGSYGANYIYTKQDIADLTQYARERGIFLLPEFDMPAHSSAWRAGVPEMMVQCSKLFTHGDTMNPTVNVTYTASHYSTSLPFLITLQHIASLFNHTTTHRSPLCQNETS